MNASQLTRRQFNEFAVSSLLPPWGDRNRAARNPRPNVLFIVADDLSNAIHRMGRVPYAPAPNLQRLISSGVRFPQAYSNCPICLPSRNSFLSGFHAHRTGHYMLMENWREKPLLRHCITFPAHFKANGYGVFGTGKVHHEGAGDAAWWTEFSRGPNYGPFPWNGRDRVASLAPRQQWMEDTPEFKEFAAREKGVKNSFFTSGRQPFPWENGFGPLEEVPEWKPDKERGIPGYSGWRNSDGTHFRYVSESDRDLLPDELSTRWAVDVLGRKHDKPFLLAVGYMRPHTPYYVPKKYFDLFPPEKLELPPHLPGDLDDTARAHREHRLYGFFRFRIIQHGGEKLWREWLRAYLASIAFMDDQVGRLLDALENSPARGNTIVVFTSDNGYHMGEKEYLFKDTLWEEGCAVPLIVRVPGLTPKGAECHAPVSLVDIYPTLTDLCDLPANPNAAGNRQPLDGKSLRPLLNHPGDRRHLEQRMALSSVRGRTGIHHALRFKTLRYIRCEDGEEELYDHALDPHEWQNLAAVSRYAAAKRDMRRRLEALLAG